MLSTILVIAAVGVVLLGLLLVHELGHYVAGALAGIPATDRRIVLLAVPPHVALSDGQDWVSPFQNDRFSTVYGRYDPERRYGRLFTASGLFAQTGVAILTAGILGVTGIAPDVSRLIVSVSFGFVVCYLGWDVLATGWRGRPFGDNTHLWRLSPPYAIGTLATVLASHALVLWWL